VDVFAYHDAIVAKQALLAAEINAADPAKMIVLSLAPVAQQPASIKPTFAFSFGLNSPAAQAPAYVVKRFRGSGLEKEEAEEPEEEYRLGIF
jgi:hypothetical protein